MLNNKFTKKINYLEKNTIEFDGKLKEINENFAINNIKDSDSVFIYGILVSSQAGLNNELPSVNLVNPQLRIDNIILENPIPNNMAAYDILKNKSNYSDNFIISYEEYF